MKLKLLFLVFCVCNLSLAQIPTTGLVSEYEFTNGSLADPINGDDFVKTGTASINVADKFGVANNAIDLNGDYLTRPNISYPTDLTFSFWIQTNTNDSNRRTIIDDKSPNVGMSIFLENGKIGIAATHERSPLGAPITYRSFEFISNTVVSDGQWHNISLTIEFDEIRNIANQLRGHIFNIDLYTDLQLESFVDTINGTSLNSVGNTNNFGNVTIANNRTNALINDNRYLDAIDDIYVYGRLLTASEVTDVAENGGICFAPDLQLSQITNIMDTTFDITFSETGTYDVAYVVKGEPFSNATIVNVVSTGGVHTISGLSSGLLYDVYVREECSVTYSSGWSGSVEIRMEGLFFVDVQASGNNNGTTWADAYTDLNAALSISGSNQVIWVAQGTYVPDASDRTKSFTIAASGIKIYGGFNGTETDLSQRDFRTNQTILSGDLQGNDNGNITYGEPTRSDNSYKVMYVNASNVTLDGITFANGHANYVTGFYQSGAGLSKEAFKTNLTIENCIFKNNVAVNGGAGILAEYKAPNSSGFLKITSSVFENNLSRFGTSFYSYTSGITDGLVADISNSTFIGNLATDNGSNLGLAGSAGWIRAYASGSTVTSSFVNNTYVNNKDDGTGGSLTNATRGTLGISQNQGVMTSNVQNCIFWNNKSRGTNTIAKSISGITNTLATNIDVGNSIDEDDFSLISASDKINTSNADPLFTNLAGGDFTLQLLSPGVDAGNTSQVPTGLSYDLSGNARVFAGVVDMGAYEQSCISTCYNLTINIVGNGTVNNNGAPLTSFSPFPANATLSLVPSPDLGNQFVVWGGDASGTANPLAVTMDSDKTITVTFMESPIYVDVDATGTNDGSSWADAYTDLNTAIANLGTFKAIWIADGTYTPTAGNRSNSFNFSTTDLKIYGGFNGTEVDLFQRDVTANKTILSGDINGDDSGVGFTTSTRGDNVYHVVRVTANGIELNGVTIQDGHANVNSAGAREGSAIFKTETVNSLALKGCIIKNNVSLVAGSVFSWFDANGTLEVENCIFDSNLSTYASGLYVGTRNNRALNVTMTNSLFSHNISTNNGGTQGFTGSSAWIRAYGSGSVLTTNISNCTFANNMDTGTISSVTERGTLSLGRSSGTLNATISNSIFYNNEGTGGVTTLAISRGHTTSANQVVVYNTIDEDGFSNISAGNLTNTSNSNPLFSDAPNKDFNLLAGSPAIDAGDNDKIPNGTTTDLSGNARVYNTTVDMGVYEYDPSLLTVTISPKVFLQGAMLNSTNGMMRDDLRVENYLPTISPYADGITCNSSVFAITGNDAIVDWIWVELRDATTNTTVLAGQSALLQRDGDVVATDGISSLTFNNPTGNYYLAIKHRNHLGVMTGNVLAFSNSVSMVDFTDANAPITFGVEAQTSFGVPSGIVAMWAGDTNGDGRLNYSGAMSDVPYIRSQVFNDPNNSVFGGPPVASYPSQGYNATDVDMDGVTVYSGAGSDVLYIRNNIFNNSSNSVFGGPPTSTYVFVQQLPEGAN